MRGRPRTRPRTLAMLLGAVAASAAVVAVVRHGRAAAKARKVPGGILIGDAAAYDEMSRLVLGSLFGSIAADVAATAEAASEATAPDGARVLEVGCGPGHLSIRLARQHGLDVTGIDLDPAMIERARGNAGRASEGFGRLPPERLPSFLVGDVAALPFPDGTFDLVVSTMSMHHWADPAAGLAEVNRVLRPGARALVWDFRQGFLPFHGRMPDPVEHVRGAPLRVVGATPWRWPWGFNLTQRIELVRAGE